MLGLGSCLVIIENQVSNDIQYMKRDYYSDVKLAERLIFENSAYLLTMLDKKVDSFTSHKTPNMRIRDRNDLLHPNNILHPQAPRSVQNPLMNLANDLTKPIWNCITRMEPVAVCGLGEQGGTEAERLVSCYNHLMVRFLERFKREHEDEGSLKVHLNFMDRRSNIDLAIKNFGREESKTEQRLHELFTLLVRVNAKRLSQMNKEECIVYEMDEAEALNEILRNLIEKEQETGRYKNLEFVGEVVSFGEMVGRYIQNVAESGSGPMFINYWLKAENLGLVLHPMMLGIYCCVKGQLAAQQEVVREVSSLSSEIENEGSDEPMFEQFKNDKCSKITFINLDGFESPLNLLLAKHLGKYLQYISFPEEERHLAFDVELSSYFKWRSQMLCRQFMAGHLEERERGQLQRLFNVREGSEREVLQLYRRLLVVPVGSLFLNSNVFKGGCGSIEGFQSHFIAFVMRQLILNQIREFNPSVIIISHANTLSLMPQHFQEIVSQLSVLTNMKIIFYNNLTHTVMPYNLVKQSNKISVLHRSYFSKYHGLKWSQYGGRECPLDRDLLSRVSVFLKVCSGTMNFGGQDREQRYQNYRIMSYAGSVLKLISQKHPAIDKYQTRFAEYIKMEKMFANYFTQKALPQYHANLLAEVEKSVYGVRGSSGAIVQLWKGFVLEYSLKLQRQKKEEFTKYLARFRSKDKSASNICNEIIALQFQIQSEFEEQSISISQNSQILISPARRYFPAPIFLLNHLPQPGDPTLHNYVGIVDEGIEKSSEQRVVLREIRFVQKQYDINQFQHFTQFNYHETHNAVILFWPVLYDAVQAVEYAFERKLYEAPITNLIFVGLKTDLTNLVGINPYNESYSNLHPRIGCTCYEPEEKGSIYIFGGFYTDLANHLDFQTDISVMRIEKDFRIALQNVPKSFYMNFTLGLTSEQSFAITGILNDFMRPRVQYQVYQLQRGEMSGHQVLLVGGVGEKFTRPFSLIGYMAHCVSFEGAAIRGIRRIKLNNVVPANVGGAVKCRSPVDISVVKTAQNRRIITSLSSVPAGTPTFSAFRLKYILQDERVPVENRGWEHKRMTYGKSYELGLSGQGEEIEGNVFVLVREGSEQRSVKANLRHVSYKEHNEGSVVLCVDGANPHLLGLCLELEQDQSEKFVNLVGNKVLLAGHHILTVDTYLLQVYALVCHPEYTEGRTILARATSRRVQQVVDGEGQQLCLSEVYCFDSGFREHVVVALEGEQVGVLHGCCFGESKAECVVKWKGGYFVRQPVKASEAGQLLQSSKEWVGLQHPNRLSFFVWVRERLACVSIQSVGRSDLASQQVLVVLEELMVSEKSVKWMLRSHSVLTLEIVDLGHEMFEGVSPPKEVIDIRVHTEQETRTYTMVVACRGLVYQGTIELEALAKTKLVLFEAVQGCLESDYQYHRLKHSGVAMFAKYLDKRQGTKEIGIERV